MTTANTNGKIFEDRISNLLLNLNLKLIPYSNIINNIKNISDLINKYGTELLITNYKYKNIYNSFGRIEFLCISNKYKINTFIECKWQQVSGSVSEKLPYMYLNFKTSDSFKDRNIIIVIDGPGWSTNSISWIKNIVNTNVLITDNNSKISIFDYNEFESWYNSKL